MLPSLDVLCERLRQTRRLGSAWPRRLRRYPNGDGHRAIRRIFRVPAIHRNRVARLLIVVREYRRKLFHDDMRGEFLPFVVVPGLWVKRGVFSRPDRIVPLPTGELRIGWMSVHEDPCGSFAVTVGCLKHGELVGKHRFVLMNRCLDVPASEISAIGARESSGAKATDRGALPVAVVDVDVVLAYAGMIEWQAERAAPGSLRNFVTEASKRSGCTQNECEGNEPRQ